jgi:hypothetical protein
MHNRSPVVPLEIIQAIIAYCSHKEVGQWSLVSSSLRPFCQKILFSEIRLDITNTNRIPELYDVLSANPYIGLCVQHLHLRLTAGDAELQRFGVLLPSIMSLSVSYLPERESTCGLHWERIDDSVKAVIYDLSSNLSSISVLQIEDFPLSLLHRCTSLDTLKMMYSNPQASKTSWLEQIPGGELSGSCEQGSGLSQLRMIDLRSLNTHRDMMTCQYLLNCAAGSLGNTYLDISEFYMLLNYVVLYFTYAGMIHHTVLKRDVNPISFHAATNLRILVIHISGLRDLVEGFRWLYGTLQSIPVINLCEQVELTLHGFVLADYAGILIATDSMLAAWNAPHLQTISFCFFPSGFGISPHPNVSTFMECNLPSLASKGVLSVFVDNWCVFPKHTLRVTA